MHSCPQKTDTDHRNELRIYIYIYTYIQHHTTSFLIASAIRSINDTMITVPKTEAASNGCVLSQGPAMKKLGAQSMERTLESLEDMK